MKKQLISIVMLLFLFSSALLAGQNETVQEKVDIQSAKQVLFNCELGAGEFRISPADIQEASVIDITYNPKRVKYFVESEVRGNNCIIDLESERLRSSSINSNDNKWDIALSTHYPMQIDLDIGACEADFDFGGIPIESFRLDIGAASGEIIFSEQNPQRLSEIEIDAGASSLTIDYIGNANFEKFSLSGGAGSFDLDFRGKYHGTSYIEIEIGLGSSDIVLPKGIPIRIETHGNNWLSSVGIHNNNLHEVDDDIYESDDFENADTKIILEIEVGLGAIDVRWRK